SENVPRSRGHEPIKIALHAAKFVEENGTEQIELAGEGSVERFLTHAEFLRQILHRDAAKPVGEEITARRRHDALRGGVLSFCDLKSRSAFFSVAGHIYLGN